jgi:LysM repeat protein
MRNSSRRQPTQVAGSDGSLQYAAPTSHHIRIGRFLAPVALLAVIGAVLVVALTPIGRPAQHAVSARSAHASVRRLPVYWTVRPGDTLTLIATKTGLSITQLEAFNPALDPSSIAPGQRLLLRRHPPLEHAAPRPLGPRFWTVKPGESFGSIAAKTQISIVTLEHLNPKLKPAALQPGDRVNLRR